MQNAILLLPYYADPCYEHTQAVEQAGVARMVLRNSACIDQARNVLAARAMQQDERYDVFVFIDGDISFQPSDLQALITSCRETRGVVGGIYSTKELSGKIIGDAEECEPVTVYDGGGLLPAHFLGFGFTAVHRLALQVMSDMCRPVKMSIAPDVCAPLFMPLIRHSQCWQEDYSFCLRAHDASVPVHLDTRPRLLHHGRYDFRLEDFELRSETKRSMTLKLKE